MCLGAYGAVVIDTSGLSIEEQVERVIEVAMETARARSTLATDTGGWNYHRPGGAFYWFAKAVVRTFARIFFGMRVRRRFDKRLHESYIFAPNHISNWDPPIVGSILPREAYIVAKAVLFRIQPIGWLISHATLGLVFYLVLTPIGLVMRALGHDPMRRGFDREAESYWIKENPHRNLAGYFRQF